MYALLDDPDRFIRYAGRVALQKTPRATGRIARMAETNSVAAMEALLALNNTAASDADRLPMLDKTIQWMQKTGLSTSGSAERAADVRDCRGGQQGRRASRRPQARARRIDQQVSGCRTRD